MAERNDINPADSSAVPGIVILGGGNGPTAVAKMLKEYDVHITIICTPADNGGSTGRLRDEFGDIMPQGDARRAVTVLMNGEQAILDAQFFDSRFEGGKIPQNGNGAGLTDHSMGNIEILMAEKLWGPIEGMRYICRKYGVKGEVLVMSIDNPHLHARLSDGEVLVGETKIDTRDKDDKRPIKKVWLEPASFICSPAAEALRRARMIILSPGDFYTSLVPHFLIDGVSRAVSANSRAQVVFIPPLMSKWGETNGFTLGTFLRELVETYGVGRDKLEVLMNNQEIPAQLAKRYKEEEQSEPIAVEQGADFQKIRHLIGQFQPTPLLNEIGLKNGVIRHDSKLLAQWIMKFLLKGNEYAFVGSFAGKMGERA